MNSAIDYIVHPQEKFNTDESHLRLQVASLASLAQLLLPPPSPLFAYMSKPVPDSPLCAAAVTHPPIASASAAAPRTIASIPFNCSSPFASASAAAHHLCLLQLLLSIASISTVPQLHPIWLLLPDCVYFSSCTPSAVLEDSSPCPMFSNNLCRVRGSVIEVRKSHITILVMPHEHPTSVTHTDNTWLNLNVLMALLSKLLYEEKVNYCRRY